MNYHVGRDGQPLGNFPKDEALAKYQRGEIRPTDLVWCEGMSDWQPASQVFGPATPAPVPQPPTPAPQPPPVQYVPPPVSPPAFQQQQQQFRPGNPTQAKPDNCLIWAILSTVLCCLPLGIVSIIYSTQVDSKYNSGDHAGAVEAAKKARLWAIISAATSLVGGVVGMIFYAIMIASAASSGGF